MTTKKRTKAYTQEFRGEAVRRAKFPSLNLSADFGVSLIYV
ncbi:hypothetical protein [Shewanella sp. KCT]|nr:hypothetical protein [Shewanella sp. KCT]